MRETGSDDQYRGRMAAGRPVPTFEDMKAIDPICGMSVDPSRAAAQRRDGDETVWFCSAGCAAAFDRSRPGGVVPPTRRLVRARLGARRAMMAAILAAAVLAAALVVAGYGTAALPVAAGALLFSCLVVCGVTAITQGRALRDVEEAAEALRRSRQSGSPAK